MNLDKKIAYSISLLRKAEPMDLRLDPENGFYLAFSGGGLATRVSTSSMPMKCCNRKLILNYE